MYADYLVHFNKNHDPKTGRFDFSVGARVNSLGAVVDRKGNVNTDIYKYVDKKGYRSKKPMGLTRVGQNRIRKVNDAVRNATKLKQKYIDAEDSNDPKAKLYKKEYEESINFIKNNINKNVRETISADEDGVRYVSIYVDDPLTRHLGFGHQSLAERATVYPDGTWEFRGKKQEKY